MTDVEKILEQHAKEQGDKDVVRQIVAGDYASLAVSRRIINRYVTPLENYIDWVREVPSPYHAENRRQKALTEDVRQAIADVPSRNLAVAMIAGGINAAWGRKKPKWVRDKKGRLYDKETHASDAKHAIGRELEREYRGAAVRKIDPKSYDDILNIAARKGPMERRQSFAKWLEEKRGITLKEWSSELVGEVGNWGADCLRQKLRQLFPRTPDGIVALSDDFEDEAAEFMAQVALSNPVYAPLREAPELWVNFEDNRGTPFIRNARDPERMQRLMRSGTMMAHIDAINRIQITPWMINEEVRAVLMKMLRKPKARNLLLKKVKTKADYGVFKLDLKVATALARNPFWLHHNIDTRGRIYPLAFFSYQRPDHIRSLFRFQHGTQLGRDGLYRLKIAAAVAYDDKSETTFNRQSHLERLMWAEANLSKIVDAAHKPMLHLQWLGKAADLMQFLAIAIELKNAFALPNPEDFITTLPLSYDATCSGGQHFALLVRDLKTAQLVNLVPWDAGEAKAIYEPGGGDREKVKAATKHVGAVEDFYQHICDLFQKRVEAAMKRQIASAADELALWWTSEKLLDRKLFKVILVPALYGSQGWNQDSDVREYLEEKEYKSHPKSGSDLKPVPKGAIKFLLRTTHEIFNEEMKGSFPVVRRFLRKLNSVVRKKRGVAMEWRSRTGLIVINEYRKVKKPRHVQRWLDDIAKRYWETTGYSGVLNAMKMSNSIAPNFIHSLDAALMVAVINRLAEKDIDFVGIHDCFGVLAPHAAELHQILREEMYKLYAHDNPLARIRETAVEMLGSEKGLPKVPDFGEYDIEMILTMTYAPFKG